MDRREFLGTVTGGLITTPLGAAAEQEGGNSLSKDASGIPSGINFSGKVKGVNLTSKPGFPAPKAYWTARLD